MINYIPFDYEYNEKKYKTYIYDTPTNENFQFLILKFVKFVDILIYTIDLEHDCLINESFIDKKKIN